MNNQSEKTKSKRIAANTLTLFLRMFVVTVVNIYTVRWVLKGLGVEDYGIFNAVAGVVTTGTCISSVLAVSTQRFYSYAIGKNDTDSLKRIFSSSLNIVLALSVIIVISFSIIGPWLIDNQLTIPADRIFAAKCIFFLSLASFIFSLVQIPYMGAVFSNEDMGVYALISTIDCILKFAAAVLISFSNSDKLIFYGTGLTLISLFIFLFYVILARKRYKECKYVTKTDKKLYLQLVSFSGWTFYGAIAGVGMIQGGIILLNIFFGPVINAAFCIANQIYNAINSLSNSVVLAFRPAMIKAYSSKEFDYLSKLFSIGNKSILYLLLCITIPFVFETDKILQFWLGQSTDEMVRFSQLFIVFTICLALQNPITTIIQATGKIRNYSLAVESLTILCIPVSWVLFKLGFSAEWIFAPMISLCVIAHFVRLLFLRNNFPAFSFKSYMLSFIFPAMIVVAVSTFTVHLLYEMISQPLYNFFGVIIISPLITLLLVYLLGIDKRERAMLSQFVKRYIKR